MNARTMCEWRALYDIRKCLSSARVCPDETQAKPQRRGHERPPLFCAKACQRPPPMTPTALESTRRPRRPRMQALTARQIDFVLSRNSVARIAFQHDGTVELVPVHYAYLSGAVVGRTSLGTKYLNWLVAREVVVEVEEVLGPFDWRSVIVRGQVRLLRERGTDEERAVFNQAVDALRAVIPGAFSDHDPTPDRRFVFRVEPWAVSGRSSTTK
ncbi:MAG TPA: pyridoxamine 5'-phosphate oxidase family protein [Gemmatimonadaceae bacterium]